MEVPEVETTLIVCVCLLLFGTSVYYSPRVKKTYNRDTCKEANARLRKNSWHVG